MEENFEITHLYFIRDRLSGTPETAVIQSLNDAVAVRGFQAFLQADDLRREEQKVPKISPLERELVHICALDRNNHVILVTEENCNVNGYRVVTSGDKIESYIDELHQGLRGEEDE